MLRVKKRKEGKAIVLDVALDLIHSFAPLA